MQIKIKKIKNNKPSLTTSPAYNLTSLQGFSLIELIIVVAIMMIVTTAVLFRQAKFSSDILITNMAYEVALSVREAAVFGLSSKSDGSQMRVGYGVHFEPSTVDGGKPDLFTNFIDTSGVSIIDIVEEDEEIFNYFFDSSDTVDKIIQLSQGQRVNKYCARVNSGGTWNCGPDNDQELNIVFVRPNPEAHITMGTSNNPDGQVYSEAKIVVESGLGDKCRTIGISVSGQISIDPIDPEDETGGCNGGME